jgi:transcription elongation factor GreB
MSEAPSNYITPEGHEKLKRELTRLWKVERPEVTRKVAEAAAMGDRSENAEYIYGKRQLREIDARVRRLSKRLDELVVVDRKPKDRDHVYFGAWVKLEDEDGRRVVYRIVGPDEIDPSKGHISIDSPVGRALLKKGCGDEAPLSRPDGESVLTLVDISYEGFDEDSGT